MTTSQSEPDRRLTVSTSYRLSPQVTDRDVAELLTSDEGVTLELEDGRRVLLDPADERSEGFVRVIDSLAQLGRPVAFELDDNDRIQRLFTPHVSAVRQVRRLDAGLLAVDLVESHGRHVLRESNSNFEAIERTVREAAESGATLIVTEDDAHDILDVRVTDVGGGGGSITGEPAPPSFFKAFRNIYDWIVHWISCSCSFPWGWFRAVSPSKAQQVFDTLAARSCNPMTVPPPCIPFMYPDDGCWGRAHEMCRLMRDQGLRPCKVWIEGSLNVATDNNPNCEVYWGWHVAPTHCVRGSGLFGFFRVRSMVFDPALFTTPVTKAQWKSVQGDSSATLTSSLWSIFYLWGTGSGTSWFSLTDPSFTQTNSVLAFYRTALQNRANQFGPPPYACP